MRIIFRLGRIGFLALIILIMGHFVPFLKSLQWFLVLGVIWIEFSEEIITRVIEALARRFFQAQVDWHWRPNGKQHAYSRGFVHLDKDGTNLGRDSCLLTIVYWAITIPIFVIGMVTVIPKIALWLSANI